MQNEGILITKSTGTLVRHLTTTYIMARNLAHQTLFDLHSCCHAIVITTGFYSEFRAHNVRKVQMVKYIVVCGQVKAAGKIYAFF